MFRPCSSQSGWRQFWRVVACGTTGDHVRRPRVECASAPLRSAGFFLTSLDWDPARSEREPRSPHGLLASQLARGSDRASLGSAYLDGASLNGASLNDTYLHNASVEGTSFLGVRGNAVEKWMFRR